VSVGETERETERESMENWKTGRIFVRRNQKSNNGYHIRCGYLRFRSIVRP